MENLSSLYSRRVECVDEVISDVHAAAARCIGKEAARVLNKKEKKPLSRSDRAAVIAFKGTLEVLISETRRIARMEERLHNSGKGKIAPKPLP